MSKVSCSQQSLSLIHSSLPPIPLTLPPPMSHLSPHPHPILFSYMYMENVINHWDQMGVLQKCMEHKLVYLETKDVVETTLALDNYKKACDSGRGAVFLSIARGKVAEGIDFDNHYGRCVVLFGIPYQYTKSHVLRARLDFMREKYQVRKIKIAQFVRFIFRLFFVIGIKFWYII